MVKVMVGCGTGIGQPDPVEDGILEAVAGVTLGDADDPDEEPDEDEVKVSARDEEASEEWDVSGQHVLEHVRVLASEGAGADEGMVLRVSREAVPVAGEGQ